MHLAPLTYPWGVGAVTVSPQHENKNLCSDIWGHWSLDGYLVVLRAVLGSLFMCGPLSYLRDPIAVAEIGAWARCMQS